MAFLVDVHSNPAYHLIFMIVTEQRLLCEHQHKPLIIALRLLIIINGDILLILLTLCPY